MRTTIFILFWLYVLAIGADNISTFEALHFFAEAGAYEANPLARWGMGNVGMASYLVINSIVSFLGLYFVAYGPHRLGPRSRILGLSIAVVARLAVSVNNFCVIHALGG